MSLLFPSTLLNYHPIASALTAHYVARCNFQQQPALTITPSSNGRQQTNKRRQRKKIKMVQQQKRIICSLQCNSCSLFAAPCLFRFTWYTYSVSFGTCVCLCVFNVLFPHHLAFDKYSILSLNWLSHQSNVSQQFDDFFFPVFLLLFCFHQLSFLFVCYGWRSTHSQHLLLQFWWCWLLSE